MKTEWIKVTERIPRHGEIVLCFGTGNKPSIAEYLGRFERYVDHVPQDRLAHIYYDSITHWMPLPEPPTDKIS